MTRPIRYRHPAGAPLPVRVVNEVQLAKRMSEAEVRQRALTDVVNPPIAVADFHRFRRAVPLPAQTP